MYVFARAQRVSESVCESGLLALWAGVKDGEAEAGAPRGYVCVYIYIYTMMAGYVDPKSTPPDAAFGYNKKVVEAYGTHKPIEA